MVGILIVSHGDFAAGLLNAVELIAGRQEKVTTIGLHHEDGVEEFESKVNQALKESYHYELVGDCQVNLIQASQRVSMRYLDISAVTSQLGELTAKKLKILVQTREHDQVYDAEDNYLPEVTQEAYIQALEQALKDARSCYTTVEFDVPLKYTGGKWLVLTAPELLTALSGGTAA